MINAKDQARALKYRRLALAEPDKSRVALLLKLADEAENGVLCTPDRNAERAEPPKTVR